MKNDLNSNTSSRLSIVLCLDISPSMRLHHRIENLNSSIQLFYKELKKVDKVSNSAEVAIVTFSTEVKEVTNGFEYFDCLAGRKFTPVPHGGTNLSGAMLKSIDLLEKRLQELNDAEIDHYIPFIILVTDGDPDNTDSNRDAAVEAVLRHCERGGDCENLIAPYIIGVGENVAKDYLDRFAKDFTGEAITIEGEISEQKALFNEIFLFIAASIRNSLDGNHDLRSLYEKLSKKGTAQVKKTKKGVHLL